MPTSAVHIFFAIPELVLLLSSYIRRKDLTRCIRVCKEWSRQLEPVLWKDLVIDDTVLPRVAVPARSLRHIQSLAFCCASDTQLWLLVQGLPYNLGHTIEDSTSVCTNLRRLDIFSLESDGYELLSRPLAMLLDYNPRLTHLQVPFDFFEIDGASAAVSKLWHLQQLIVHSRVCEDAFIQRPFLLLQSCLALPELTELRFYRDVEMSWDHGDRLTVVRKLEAIIREASIARFSNFPGAKKIKSLQLPTNLSGIKNPLPLLLLKSKLLDLETCEIPWFRLDVSPREIQQVVREHCPNLKHLHCPPFFDKGQDGQAARAFIRGCRGLQSFTSSYFLDGLDHSPRMMLSELVMYHHTTLEVLKLTEPVQLFSRDLQSVLSQCKQLRRFWAIGDDNRYDMSGLAFRDIARSDWVCSELRELCVTLNRCRNRGDTFVDLGEEEQQDDPRVWLTASTTKRVYQQIGRLGKLEILELNIDRTPRTKAKEYDYMWDLTLSKGYLSEMTGLKNLKSLRFRADFWSAMGQAEMEFMHEHWPLLNEIAINCDVSESHSNKHWEWLRDKRPRLRFIGKERYWNL